jgi:hypothetical protein
MKRQLIAALAASALSIIASGAQANTVDGVISPGEYNGAIVTNTPWIPHNTVNDFSTFYNGNELVAQQDYFGLSGQGIELAVQSLPAALTHDHSFGADGLNFVNAYFGNATTGSVAVFEFENNRAFNLATGKEYDYASSLIPYAFSPETPYVSGVSQGFVGEASASFAAINQVYAGLGLPTLSAGDPFQLRILQAGSYTPDNAGGAHFGTLFVPAGAASVPELGTWAMMLAGFGIIGFAMRRKQQNITILKIA